MFGWLDGFLGGGSASSSSGSTGTGNSRSGGNPNEGWTLSGPRTPIMSYTSTSSSYTADGVLRDKPRQWVSPVGSVLPVGMTPSDYRAAIKHEELMKYALIGLVGFVVVRQL